MERVGEFVPARGLRVRWGKLMGTANLKSLREKGVGPFRLAFLGRPALFQQIAAPHRNNIHLSTLCVYGVWVLLLHFGHYGGLLANLQNAQRRLRLQFRQLRYSIRARIKVSDAIKARVQLGSCDNAVVKRAGGNPGKRAQNNFFYNRATIANRLFLERSSIILIISI